MSKVSPTHLLFSLNLQSSKLPSFQLGTAECTERLNPPTLVRRLKSCSYLSVPGRVSLPRPPAGRAHSVGRAPSVSWWRQQAPAPVSYTHLRAHETDSYLVCRLLLEKKNREFRSKTLVFLVFPLPPVASLCLKSIKVFGRYSHVASRCLSLFTNDPSE